VPINNGDYLTVTGYMGDTGVIKPEAADLEVDSSGNPSIACRWGARGSGYEYGITDGRIVARTMKY
jgi:hypothetical protein